MNTIKCKDCTGVMQEFDIHVEFCPLCGREEHLHTNLRPKWVGTPHSLKQQISTDLQVLIDLAEQRGGPEKEFFVPHLKDIQKQYWE